MYYCWDRSDGRHALHQIVSSTLTYFETIRKDEIRKFLNPRAKNKVLLSCQTEYFQSSVLFGSLTEASVLLRQCCFANQINRSH